MATDSAPYKGDPFAELGVPSTATIEEVRRAFRRRARETHPDHRPGDPLAARRFARLRAAYETALDRLKNGDRGEPTRPRAEHAGSAKRGRGLTEHELAGRVNGLHDPTALRRILVRH